MRLAYWGGRVQGRKRNYNYVSNKKISKMMEIQYQVHSEAKIRWVVKAYNDWQEMRLDRNNEIDQKILSADLNDIGSLTKRNLEYSLCRFICEFHKSRENGDYPGHTLYQLAYAIQNFL